MRTGDVSSYMCKANNTDECPLLVTMLERLCLLAYQLTKHIFPWPYEAFSSKKLFPNPLVVLQFNKDAIK